MMKRLYKIALGAILVGMTLPAQAVRSYVCDFEEDSIRNRWVLNPATSSVYSNLDNKWYIGAPGNNSRTGQYGLYISDDNGVTAEYKNTSCMVYAYDTVSLDNISGDYTLTFDYCAMGNVASAKDGLYLMWIPVTHPVTGQPVKFNSNSTFNGIPTNMQDYLIRLDPSANMDYLNGTSTWKQCCVKIPGSLCDGTPHYLAFVWANTGNLAQQPGAMIDNIDITDQPPCEPVTDVKVSMTGNSVVVRWTGTAAEYEVTAYSYDSESWAGPKIVQGDSTNFSNLAIGQTDFIVRAKCDDRHYSLKTITSKLIYYPDQMCVNYLDLSNAKCYVHNPNNKPNNTLTYSDFQLVAPVDKGPSSMASRHVVHFDRNEREIRTGNMAKTIPDGELASVRLGNWDSNDEAERIEFSFDVDTIQYPVLLLKYMPILEAPGHSDHENPRFKLDILVGGESIGRCGAADFNANDVLVGGSGDVKPAYAAQGWHKTAKAISQTSEDVVWKEWTTVGVNLRKKEYVGKKLTARLTTHDCTFSAHCGYAYFTLGCSDGKLKGMKCGEINPVFEAPDGFAYRWAYAYNEKYRRFDGSLPEQYVVGRGQTYEAGLMDDSLYVVDCMFVQDTTCYFSLYASTLATNPVSKIGRPLIKKSCRDGKYTVKFDASQSHVQEINHVTGDTLRSKSYHIDSYEWHVEGLSSTWSYEVAPVFEFPVSGGDYRVTLRTTCGICESVAEYNLHLKPLGETRDTVTVILCDDVRKAGYVWEEKTKLSKDTAYFNYGLDSVVLFNEETSCDSIIYLNLLEPIRVFEDTMLLPESLPFTTHGRTYGEGTKSLIDTIPMSDTSCDTTWVLNLEIYESLLAHLKDTLFKLCEGDPFIRLDYQITRGRSLRYSYTFDDPAIPDLSPVSEVQKQGWDSLFIALDPKLYPNVYHGTLLLEDSLPIANVTLPFTLIMRYSSSVIAQRWNDVLAIKNADYNGGYEFDSVQWYVDNTPIPGAIDFNYYTGDDVQLQFGKEYTALLTRKSDGVKLFTCPMVPTPMPADVTNMPSLVPPSAPMGIKGQGVASWYDMLGRKYSSENYDNSTIITPANAGYYILVLQSALSPASRTIHQVMVYSK